jgi:hypothetical protein
VQDGKLWKLLISPEDSFGKGLDRVAQGGSASVDFEGEDVL